MDPLVSTRQHEESVTDATCGGIPSSPRWAGGRSGKLLVKILVKFFGAAVTVAETIASLIVAVARLIYVLTRRPAQWPLVPPGRQPVRTPAIPDSSQAIVQTTQNRRAVRRRKSARPRLS